MAGAQQVTLAGLARRMGQLAHDVTRLQRWTASGVWARVLAAVQADDALHTLLVDSTTMRAHQHASGARKKTDRKPSCTAAAA